MNTMFKEKLLNFKLLCLPASWVDNTKRSMIWKPLNNPVLAYLLSLLSQDQLFFAGCEAIAVDP